MYFTIVLSQSSTPGIRQRLYREAWRCGFRKTPKHRKNSLSVILEPYDGPREKRIEKDELTKVLSESPAVASWIPVD